MKKMLLSFLPLFLLLVLHSSLSGKAESWISVMPSEARVGEIVDVNVEKTEEAVSVIYRLTCDGEPVFTGEEDTHFQSSFKPRKEGNYMLEVSIQYNNGDTKTEKAEVAVKGDIGPGTESIQIYSQKDGWWKDKAYSRSDLENAGCAIFTLSHAIHNMGRSGEETEPEQLALTYRSCYTKNGTANSRLITRAAEDYGFTTKNGLLKSKTDIKEALKYGDQFSFGIVLGHIALMAGIDLENNKVLIIDSAPSATFERIKRGKIYYFADGEYREASNPKDIPGSRYFFETQYYGGLSYYMDLEYCARRGGRLIRPLWLSIQDESGIKEAELISLGTGQSTILAGGEKLTLPTRELKWGLDSEPKMAIAKDNKSITMWNAENKRIATIPAYTLIPVLKMETERACIVYRNNRGYIKLEEVEILEPTGGEYQTGILAVEGKTEGRSQIKVRIGPSEKYRILESWPVGTEVTIVGKEEDFLWVEANNRRGWIKQDFILTEEKDRQEIVQGE